MKKTNKQKINPFVLSELECECKVSAFLLSAMKYSTQGNVSIFQRASLSHDSIEGQMIEEGWDQRFDPGINLNEKVTLNKSNWVSVGETFL